MSSLLTRRAQEYFEVFDELHADRRDCRRAETSH